jgi:hypothetical protein
MQTERIYGMTIHGWILSLANTHLIVKDNSLQRETSSWKI